MTPDIQSTSENSSEIQKTPESQKAPGNHKIPDIQETSDNQEKSPDIQKTPYQRTDSEVEVSETRMEEKPVKREGVLKCKLCSKYIKQSQLLAHRKTHDGEKNVELQNSEISQSSDEVEKPKQTDLENRFDRMM